MKHISPHLITKLASRLIHFGYLILKKWLKTSPELLCTILLSMNFTLMENVCLSVRASMAILLRQAWEFGKSHICVNTGLLEPVCLFWHKIPSD